MVDVVLPKEGAEELKKKIETKANGFCVTNLVPTFKTEAERDGEARAWPTVTRRDDDTMAQRKSVEDAN